MKTYSNKILTGLLFAISLFVESCDDFLDVAPPYTQDAENFFDGRRLRGGR